MLRQWIQSFTTQDNNIPKQDPQPHFPLHLLLKTPGLGKPQRNAFTNNLINNTVLYPHCCKQHPRTIHHSIPKQCQSSRSQVIWLLLWRNVYWYSYVGTIFCELGTSLPVRVLHSSKFTSKLSVVGFLPYLPTWPFNYRKRLTRIGNHFSNPSSPPPISSPQRSSPPQNSTN